MIFRPFNSSNPRNPRNPRNPAGASRSMSRKTIAALLLSAALALTCVPASHARTGFGRPTADAPERPAPEGIVRFLLRMFGFVGGVMDPNGQH